MDLILGPSPNPNSLPKLTYSVRKPPSSQLLQPEPGIKLFFLSLFTSTNLLTKPTNDTDMQGAPNLTLLPTPSTTTPQAHHLKWMTPSPCPLLSSQFSVPSLPSTNSHTTQKGMLFQTHTSLLQPCQKSFNGQSFPRQLQ